LTDDNDVFLHTQAAEFDERHRFEPFQNAVPVETLEETQFFKGLAMTADLLANRTKTTEPFFLWTHFEGFRGLWDFPMTYRRKFRDDEDPMPYPGVKPPKITGTEIDPDELQAVMEAYSGGAAVLDDALSGLIGVLEESKLGSETIFVFVSTRGFSLGEHGQIGINNELFGENVQLPLFVRFPDGLEAAVRLPALVQPNDLAVFLNDLSNARSPMFRLVREEIETIHESLKIAGENESALVTPDWFLRKTSGGHVELYAKPDDRWEINDVADRCPEIVKELTGGYSR
jgi:membrane-anchored protein YejM (alkaline phosphatase superfamily)